MVLSDRKIRERLLWERVIEPFCDAQVSKGVISYGLSSMGYDIRLGRKFKVFDSLISMHTKVIDPKSSDWHAGFSEYDVNAGVPVIIPPHSFALAESLEYIRMPRDLLVICLGKSTYARCGIIPHVTPLEPEWEGRITIEISNTTPLPAKVYAGEGMLQLLFLRAEGECEVSYRDRKGKYQCQEGLTMPKVSPI